MDELISWLHQTREILYCIHDFGPTSSFTPHLISNDYQSEHCFVLYVIATLLLITFGQIASPKLQSYGNGIHLDLSKTIVLNLNSLLSYQHRTSRASYACNRSIHHCRAQPCHTYQYCRYHSSSRIEEQRLPMPCSQIALFCCDTMLQPIPWINGK